LESLLVGRQALTYSRLQPYGTILLLVLLFPKIHVHLQPTVSGSGHLGAWILGASIVFALVASWFSFAADYSRYLPRQTSSGAVAGWVAAGAGLPAAGLGILGVLLFSINTSTGDLLTTIVHATSRPPWARPRRPVTQNASITS